MRRRLLLFAAVLSLSACPEHRGSASGASDGGAASDELADLEPDDVNSDGGQYVLTPQKLDAFIAYQERTLVLYAQMLDDLAKPDAAAAKDGGLATAGTSVARVRKHAEAQEKVRRELGLSQRDVREMERLVGDVISRRAMTHAGDEDASIQQMKELAAKLPEEQRAEFTATIASLEKQQEELRSLAEERRKYGDANVDLVLTREAELTRQWNQAIATFAGTKEKAPARGGADGGAAGPADAGVRVVEEHGVGDAGVATASATSADGGALRGSACTDAGSPRPTR